MDKKMIDKYEQGEQGYNPFLIGPRWQVAQLNHAFEEELEQIERLDIHYKTDEVFFLIEGRAVLIAADVKGDNIEYDIELMKPGVTYNIRKDVWHNIAMYKGSKVLIIEDANTHLGDYEFLYLSKSQKDELVHKVKQLISA